MIISYNLEIIKKPIVCLLKSFNLLIRNRRLLQNIVNYYLCAESKSGMGRLYELFQKCVKTLQNHKQAQTGSNEKLFQSWAL